MSSKQQSKILGISLIYRNEKGAVLAVGLMLLAVLTLLGTTAIMTTTTDIKISGNYRTSVQAKYAAEAGVEEMRGRLKGTSATNTNFIGDPATTPDPLWSAYVLTSSSWQTSNDPNYSGSYRNYIPTSSQTNTTITSNTIQTANPPAMSYWVKIRHKRESDKVPGETYFDGGSGSDDIIYYGYRNSTSTTLEEFTTTVSNPTTGSPVEIIRSYGSSGQSTSIIEVQVRRTKGPPVVAALYGNSVGGGGNVTVNGNDNCVPSAASLPAVAFVTSQTLSGGSVTLTSTAGSTTQLATPINIAQRVNELASKATVTLTADQTNYTVGSPTNYEIVYCDATVLSPDQQLDLKNVTGYGTLVVRGDLYFSGNLTWRGIIIASGNVDFYGGGSDAKNILGAVLANNTAAVQGNVTITYDSCEVANAEDNYSLSVSRWRDTRL